MSTLLSNRNWQQNPPEQFPPTDAAAWGYDYHGLWKTLLLYGVEQTMRWIPRGDFLMGSPEEEPERDDDEQQHEVELTSGFWLADTACTQALWQAVMGENPSEFTDAENPVENVSWHDAMEFLEKLNNHTADGLFQLPSEAQWEYACRAGTTSAFYLGENITSEQVNFDGNAPYNNEPESKYRGKTVPVKSFTPNPWGLYQMHGNVREWCSDWFEHDYPAGKQIDPVGPEDGARRVLRGGCWINGGRRCRSASRAHYVPDGRDDRVGFRLSQAGFI
ncbi:sulfatase-modifying factor protein [Chromatiales bacterium (ex Bugula neritina AB1)]|nr:sulfatase-modifying factor protein [Chromatiales bacterium (ex Bugula neritina AB1)]